MVNRQSSIIDDSSIGNRQLGLREGEASKNRAEPGRSIDNVAQRPLRERQSTIDNRQFLRGLFSGGTLATETLLGLQPFLAPLYANVPLTPEQSLADVMTSQAHTILDLGEDLFTQGRLHPMMDNELRLRRLRQEAADASVGTLLLDVVLGEGAHPDSAGELAPAIAEVKAARPELDVVAIVVGTDGDPQAREEQIGKLEEAGAAVFDNVTAVVEHVAAHRAAAPDPLDKPLSLADFGGELAAINVGLESFYDSLVEQSAQAIHVDWRPPAGGNERLAGILARLR
jgi:FdrA protein